MKLGLSIRLFVCIALVGIFLYSYINKQNAIVKLRLEIPKLEAQLSTIEEENVRLRYEIDRFENPAHLMQLLREPEYSHLRQPFESEVDIIHE